MGVSEGGINVSSYFVCHPFVFPVDEEVNHWEVAVEEAIGMGRMLPFFHCPEDWPPFWMMEGEKKEGKGRECGCTLFVERNTVV